MSLICVVCVDRHMAPIDPRYPCPCSCHTTPSPDLVKADPVNHPSHYTSLPAVCECGRTVECITVVEHLNFCRGNSVKYIWRAGAKGNEIEDLKKARWYLDREIERLEKAR